MIEITRLFEDYLLMLQDMNYKYDNYIKVNEEVREVYQNSVFASPTVLTEYKNMIGKLQREEELVLNSFLKSKHLCNKLKFDLAESLFIEELPMINVKVEIEGGDIYEITLTHEGKLTRDCNQWKLDFRKEEII